MCGCGDDDQVMSEDKIELHNKIHKHHAEKSEKMATSLDSVVKGIQEASDLFRE